MAGAAFLSLIMVSLLFLIQSILLGLPLAMRKIGKGEGDMGGLLASSLNRIDRRT